MTDSTCSKVGDRLGAAVGFKVGERLGAAVGFNEGERLGAAVGALLGYEQMTLLSESVAFITCSISTCVDQTNCGKATG